MAITFEEKSELGKNIAIVFVLVAVSSGAGFLGWKLSQGVPVEEVVIAPNSVRINKQVLEDSRLTALEMFPSLPPAMVGEVRENPFAEYDGPAATTTLPEYETEQIQ